MSASVEPTSPDQIVVLKFVKMEELLVSRVIVSVLTDTGNRGR